MKKTTFKIISTLLLVTLSSLAWGKSDGGNGTGGGVGLVCSENGVSHIYLADTYKLGQTVQFKALQLTDEHSAFVAAGYYFNKLRSTKLFTLPEVSDSQDASLMIADYLEGRNNQLNYVNKPRLQLLNDDNLKAIPDNCSKIQLAIQHLSTGEVELNEPAVQQLSPTDQILLKLHETLISLRNESGADTSPIRAELNLISGNPDFSFAELLRGLEAVPWSRPLACGKNLEYQQMINLVKSYYPIQSTAELSFSLYNYPGPLLPDGSLSNIVKSGVSTSQIDVFSKPTTNGLYNPDAAKNIVASFRIQKIILQDQTGKTGIEHCQVRVQTSRPFKISREQMIKEIQLNYMSRP